MAEATQEQTQQRKPQKRGDQIILTRQIALGDGTRSAGTVMGTLTKGTEIDAKNRPEDETGNPTNEGDNIKIENVKPAEGVTYNELRHLSMNPNAYVVDDPENVTPAG